MESGVGEHRCFTPCCRLYLAAQRAATVLVLVGLLGVGDVSASEGTAPPWPLQCGSLAPALAPWPLPLFATQPEATMGEGNMICIECEQHLCTCLIASSDDDDGGGGGRGGGGGDPSGNATATPPPSLATCAGLPLLATWRCDSAAARDAAVRCVRKFVQCKRAVAEAIVTNGTYDGSTEWCVSWGRSMHAAVVANSFYMDDLAMAHGGALPQSFAAFNSSLGASCLNSSCATFAFLASGAQGGCTADSFNITAVCEYDGPLTPLTPGEPDSNASTPSAAPTGTGTGDADANQTTAPAAEPTTTTTITEAPTPTAAPTAAPTDPSVAAATLAVDIDVARAAASGEAATTAASAPASEFMMNTFIPLAERVVARLLAAHAEAAALLPVLPAGSTVDMLLAAANRSGSDAAVVVAEVAMHLESVDTEGREALVRVHVIAAAGSVDGRGAQLMAATLSGWALEPAARPAALQALGFIGAPDPVGGDPRLSPFELRSIPNDDGAGGFPLWAFFVVAIGGALLGAVMGLTAARVTSGGDAVPLRERLLQEPMLHGAAA